jgi:hypothetical protein
MNLETAFAASAFCTVLETDANGKPVLVRVPAHGCKCAHVRIARDTNTKFPRVLLNCQHVPDNANADSFPCQGNEKGICYHSLAALMHVAQLAKTEIRFSENDQHNANEIAVRLLNNRNLTVGYSIHVKKTPEPVKPVPAKPLPPEAKQAIDSAAGYPAPAASSPAPQPATQTPFSYRNANGYTKDQLRILNDPGEQETQALMVAMEGNDGGTKPRKRKTSKRRGK